MKKAKGFLAFLTALMLLGGLCFATAEETALGSVPERGLILPLTQDDIDMGLSLQYDVLSTGFAPSLPVLVITYTDRPLMEQYLAAYATGDLDEATQAALTAELREYCSVPAGQVLLLEKETYDSLTQGGTTMTDVLGVPETLLLGENDGYVYVGFDYSQLLQSEDAELLARAVNASRRAGELMATAAFQPLVFAEGEFDPPVTAFPAFSTTDLDGNPVTNEIFAGKDLTVVNIWGTFCGPCIDEMDELAAWREAMPENVQLIGLVSDLYSLEDTETLEMAQLICESTGATNYPSLVANTDFTPLLATIVGVPTTYFVDSTGAVVGQPIVGANVPACMAFVEDYLNAK